MIGLIVTIIVLLILAGVSLNLVAGSDGIINKASKAVSETKKATIKEEVELLIAELQMDYYSDYANNKANYSTALDYAKAQLQTGTKKTGSGVTIKYTAQKYYYDNIGFEIDTNGNVKVGEQTGNSGGTTTPTTSPTVTTTPEPKYTVSYDSNGDGENPTASESEAGKSISLPTLTREGYNFLGWAIEQDSETPDYTSNYPVTGNATLYAVWSPIQSYHAQHPELHIPTGFRYLTGSWDEGYVITDSPEDSLELGNEFVWIPVASSTAYKKTLGKNNWYLREGSTSEDSGAPGDTYTIEQTIQGDVLGITNILGKTVTSTLDATIPEKDVVNSAGGFWVGRYEAGVVSDTVRTEYIAGIPELSDTEYVASNTYWTGKTIVVKPGAEPARTITQSKALEIANSWKSGNAGSGTVAFKSGLITGAQWDTMCNFIGWDICNSDCTTWGNYTNATSAEYSGLHSNDLRSDWVQGDGSKKGANASNRWIFPTGKFIHDGNSNPTTSKKNIFDVAGNVWEWTTEVPKYNSVHAVFRGGSANDSGSWLLATLRYGGHTAATHAGWYIGFRIVLYVQ